MPAALTPRVANKTRLPPSRVHYVAPKPLTIGFGVFFFVNGFASIFRDIKNSPLSKPVCVVKMNRSDDELRNKVVSKARRMKQAEIDRPTLLAQTVYVGTLGLLFVLPVVAGAYIGHWLDGHLEGYSMRWTLSLIALGIVVGIVNVYLFVKE